MRLTAIYQRTAFLYWVAIVASIGLSWWINVRELVINPDAFCYLYSAEEMGKAGLHAAMHLCPQAMWPFYSGLIYAVVTLTHLSFLTAAFLVNAIFSAWSVVMFIAIVRELSANRRVWWLATAVILLAHDFNILRQDIIRDHGFWAFYLTSLYFLLRYFRQLTWQYAAGWYGSLIIATLFRIEAAIFLLVLPLTIWFDGSLSWRQRARSFIVLTLPLWVLVVAVGGWWLWHAESSLQYFGRLAEIIRQWHQGVALMRDKYTATQSAVATTVLTHVSLRDANVVVMLLMLSWYVVNVIGSVSIVCAVLVLYAWVSRAASLSRQALLVMLGYLLVNLMVTAIFFAENHFLAKRYLVALSLVLMLWVPFALDKLWRSSRPFLQVGAAIAALSLIVSGVGGIFHFGHSKDYVRQAGDWLAHNMPPVAKLYTNDYQLMYYSQHFGTDIFNKRSTYEDVQMIAHERWRQYDYLALLMNKQKGDQTAIVMQEIHLAPIQVFTGSHGDHIYIYKVSQQEKRT